MPLLEVKNLTKKFSGKKGEVVAVDNVSFTAEAGEIFGLLGPNGAGKTTTIRLIATILQPTSGDVMVAGFDINKQPEQVRRNIGVLTTDIGLYDRFTARENLRYFGQLYGLYGEKLEQRINELLGLLEMEDFADRRAGKFSTGMKQKVAIARSVIHDPEVIIFDEPTSGLDVLASQTVVNFMLKARELGKLVILSTHEMHNAEKLCGRVAIIHQGRLVFVGNLENIEKQTGKKSLEESFLSIVKKTSGEILPEKVQPEIKPKFFSPKGLAFGSRIYPWWRLVLAVAVAAAVIIYELSLKK
ncbi:MAG: ATP-binding cassette domain-containing protein [Patescibacteria group bacterium]|jgi:sodium transport system ATP-binding protein